jgi:hypothetical protein
MDWPSRRCDVEACNQFYTVKRANLRTVLWARVLSLVHTFSVCSLVVMNSERDGMKFSGLKSLMISHGERRIV